MDYTYQSDGKNKKMLDMHFCGDNLFEHFHDFIVSDDLVIHHRTKVITMNSRRKRNYYTSFSKKKLNRVQRSFKKNFNIIKQLAPDCPAENDIGQIIDKIIQLMKH